MRESFHQSTYSSRRDAKICPVDMEMLQPPINKPKKKKQNEQQHRIALKYVLSMEHSVQCVQCQSLGKLLIRFGPINLADAAFDIVCYFGSGFSLITQTTLSVRVNNKWTYPWTTCYLI